MLNMIDRASDMHDACDKSLKDCDDPCTTIHTTLCVGVADVYIANVTCTHKVKTL